MAGFDPSKYGSKKSKIYGSSAADTRVDSGTETGFDPSRYGDSKSKLYSPGSMVITPEPVETQQKKRERQVVSPYGTFLGGFSFAGDRQKTAKELADEKAQQELSEQEYQRLLGLELDKYRTEVEKAGKKAQEEKAPYNIHAFGGYDANRTTEAERQYAAMKADLNKAESLQYDVKGREALDKLTEEQTAALEVLASTEGVPAAAAQADYDRKVAARETLLASGLSEDELSQLEENILEEGLVLMPLIVWNDTIVDGHNRYRIAQAHPGIGFRTHEKQFSNRYEALSWICKNQLGRRNLTPQQKKYLIGQRYDAEKKTHGGDRKSNLPESSGQNDHLIVAQKTRERIASETGTSESYVKRADQYAKGVDAAEEVLPGIKNDLLLGKFKPRETDVAAVARASPEERREKAEQLRVIPEKKPKADKESARSGAKLRQEVYATIDKSYEDMKDSKRVTEDSALVSLRYTARNMVETCDVLFTNFPGLLEKPDYKDQVIEIMQEPKQYILKLEGETDNEQH